METYKILDSRVGEWFIQCFQADHQYDELTLRRVDEPGSITLVTMDDGSFSLTADLSEPLEFANHKELRKWQLGLARLIDYASARRQRT